MTTNNELNAQGLKDLLIERIGKYLSIGERATKNTLEERAIFIGEKFAMINVLDMLDELYPGSEK